MNKIALYAVLFLFIATNHYSVYAQTPTPPTSPSGPIYIVREGDTLWDIALQFNINVNELSTVNNLIDGNIYPGDELVIPGLDGVSGFLTSRTIRYGENYLVLMRQYQLDAEMMQILNHLTSPTELYAGATLVLLQQEDQVEFSSKTNLNSFETLLEVSVRQNTDPWTLVQINRIDGSWAALQDDVIFLSSGASMAQYSGFPEVFGTVSVDPLPIVQGTTIKISITPNGDADFSGELIGKSLHFFTHEDGAMVSLQGVYALTDPGLYPLRIDATLEDGTKHSYEQNVLVISGNYPEDPLLYVDPATIDPAITEPETSLIESIVALITPEQYWTGYFSTPASLYADSTYFTSRFGNRRTYIGIGTELEISGFHTGLDFGGGVGLPITAPASGMVVFAELLPVRGNATIIDHGWGVFSGFWHQDQINVEVGDFVQQGEVIGLVGGTGRVTGAHLHWEIWVNGVQVDPLQWLRNIYP